VNFIPSSNLPEIILIEPDLFEDNRGFFLEMYHKEKFKEAGIEGDFVQDNRSHSQQGTLRGLHYQLKRPQGKLVWVLSGEIFDVAVDIRPGSVSFGQWAGVELNASSHRQLYVPEGFAHGFVVLSESALFHYHCTTESAPQYEVAIAWNDPDIGVKWPCEPQSISGKDREAPRLRDIPLEHLPGAAK
jgi:dTDP-4-dehydrorhamnose 3,5-epimerase